VPINDVHLLREMVSTSIAQPRFRTFLFACFGGVALVLAAVGIYGVLSYAVSQRTREFGIRIALGARRLDLAQLIVSQGSRLVLIGLSIAFVIAFAVRKVLESVLFNLSSSDPMTFALVTGCVVGIATLAVVAPARRAMKSDPMAAIRYE
jgi:putative ABC transport system permease protein